MKRRSMLVGLAAAGLDLEAQTNSFGSESLYIPKAQLVEDRKLLHDFMDEFAFVDFVTSEPSLRITHIPVVFDHNAGKNGVLYGHISRQNPQTEAILAGRSAVIVFHGPHSYISPTWYAKTEVVPTWNFATVHATGKLMAVTRENAVRDLLTKLVRKFEGPASSYDFAKLPQSYTSGLMAGILAFALEIELLEGKFKLGQERSEADKESILQHLRTAQPEPSLYDFTASFYARPKSQ
ncbi:MAG: FMN-binding negative transcriptional regulator [Bryobacteraceae bacterium]|jgi:transcriptional regulator